MPTDFNNPYEDFEVIVATKQFGVPLERLREMVATLYLLCYGSVSSLLREAV